MTTEELDQGFQTHNPSQTYQVFMLHCQACQTDEYYQPGERRPIDQIRKRMCDHCYSVHLKVQDRIDLARGSLELEPTPKPVHRQPWNALLA